MGSFKTHLFLHLFLHLILLLLLLLSPFIRGWNIARGKNTDGYDNKENAWLGTDGGFYYAFSTRGYFPWWQTDLGDEYHVEWISVYGTAGRRTEFGTTAWDMEDAYLNTYLKNSLDELYLVGKKNYFEKGSYHPNISLINRYIRVISESVLIWIYEVEAGGEKANETEIEAYYDARRQAIEEEKSMQTEEEEYEYPDDMNYYIMLLDEEKKRIKNEKIARKSTKTKNGKGRTPGRPGNNEGNGNNWGPGEPGREVEEEEEEEDDIDYAGKSTADILLKRPSKYGFWIITVAASTYLFLP